MSTIGWLFILMAGLLIRQVAKGRVLETPDDLSDAFLAIVTGDNAGFTAVLARTGTFNQADQAEETNLGTGMLRHVGPRDGRYKLGNVKPWVEDTAYSIGPMFGIKTIYGVSGGSVPGSYHPKGLALDFMTSDKGVGDKLANYAVANAAAYGITEVIWWGRIWTKSQGWHAYNGPRDHKDHVHLSIPNDPVGSKQRALKNA